MRASALLDSGLSLNPDSTARRLCNLVKFLNLCEPQVHVCRMGSHLLKLTQLVLEKQGFEPTGPSHLTTFPYQGPGTQLVSSE